MTRRQLISTRIAQRLSKQMEEYAFTDTAVYYPQPSSSTGLDGHGQPIYATTGTEIACSIVDEFRAGERERWKPIGDVTNTLAEVRFIAPPIPEKGAKIKLTSKSVILLADPKTYEVIFIQDRGVFGYVCSLKLGEM